MAVIFAFSAQTKPELPDFGDNDFWAKKLGHMAGYATLAWAYLHGLTYGGRPLTGRTALLAVVLAGLYGASDEYHQSFVAGRGAAMMDVGFDTAGAVLGAAARVVWRCVASEKDLRGLQDPGGLEDKPAGS